MYLRIFSRVAELTGFGTGLKLSKTIRISSFVNGCGVDRFWNGVKTLLLYLEDMTDEVAELTGFGTGLKLRIRVGV